MHLIQNILHEEQKFCDFHGVLLIHYVFGEFLYGNAVLYRLYSSYHKNSSYKCDWLYKKQKQIIEWRIMNNDNITFS